LAGLALAAVLLPLEARAAVKTNEAAIEYLPFGLTFDHAERSEILFSRFFEEVVSSDSIVFDRFTGPSSRFAWARRQNSMGYQSFERFNKDGANLFGTIALDSLRTAALAALPLDLWAEFWQRRLANFLSVSIGNPEEEHIELRSISYSEVRSSWERANENGAIQWGFRPWTTSPYLYFLGHAGRLDGRPLVTVEGRAGYTLFGSAKLETRLTLQLPALFRLAAGAAIDPARIGWTEVGATRVAVTLERVLASGGRAEGVFYVGFRSAVNSFFSNPRHENLLIAGFSRHW